MAYKDPEEKKQWFKRVVQQRRLDWVATNGPCVKCGSWENLELDHVDPAFKVSHRIWSWSDARRLAELTKCQVLCKKCHTEKTRLQSFPERQHGTTTMYDHAFCRCDPCRGAKRDAKRRQRAAKRNAVILGETGGS